MVIPDDVMTRLSRLETANRRLRKAVGLLLLAGAAALLTGQDRTIDGVVSARALQIRDKDDAPRAWLGVNDINETTLAFYGKDESVTRLLLTTARSGPARLVASDVTGRARLTCGIGTEGVTELAVFDERGMQRAALRMAPQGPPQIQLLDAAGHAVTELRADAEGASAICLRDGASRDRLRLDVGKSGVPSVVLFAPSKATAAPALEKDGMAAFLIRDDDGRNRVNVAIERGAGPAVELADEAGRTHARLHLSPKGDPLLELSDDKGRVVFKAPGK